jgi:Domain of unknown function (DUF4450)/Bacterial alpha-L-rhamnosidase 6 hairpin glycosidase domain
MILINTYSMRTFSFLLSFFLLLLTGYNVCAQQTNRQTYWHDKERSIRYHPDGTDFVIINGNRRFTRALYGTNTAFRVEAGDLPEFALYMPGMGGNMKFGLINNDSSKWLINAASVTARYRPGMMIYDIEDALLGKGKLHLEVLAMGDAEGMIVKLQFENVTVPVQLAWVYGGASGKKFSRDGDMGPDPESSFYLKPEYCTDNRYTINGNQFILNYGSGLVAEWDPYVNKNFATDTVKPVKIGKEQTIIGMFPASSVVQVADAAQQNTPAQLLHSQQTAAPLITGHWSVKNNEIYFMAIQKPGNETSVAYADADKIFNRAEVARKKITDRIKIITPDPYINTLGGVLATAADAIWETPTYLHGSIGWRIRLNGWRGPYAGDVLGWHDRAKMHFKSYALSQVTTPLTGPVVMDTALHLARSLEQMGTAVFSSGYISRNPDGDIRPHHYDMNLVYMDALIRHFYWTGDLAFEKEMWPVITRHLAWEKRNFDADDDGLYDAYAAIWASDALEYSGGAVTHSSAYNYKANKEAAVIAKLIGEDAKLYESEAAKILEAINTKLWMPQQGCYAEYKDLLGKQLLHPGAALWTIYHSIDSDVPDPFQAYQSLQYIDDHIPHIPVHAKGLEDGYETVSTTNWMPYDWSLNNVATAEVMHTALANWQAGRNENAFKLYKSELLSTMYLGGSPGNIGQISFYDAARGEAYRDFADPIAMTARSTVEGLFGIRPNALKNELLIKPGFPSAWDSASIRTPDIVFKFKRDRKKDEYIIVSFFEKQLDVKFIAPVNGNLVKSILVNGKKAGWKNANEAIGHPAIEINCGTQKKYAIIIVWAGNETIATGEEKIYTNGSRLQVQFPGALVQQINDPQHVLQQIQKTADRLTGLINTNTGHHTIFVQLRQHQFTWWYPLTINVKDAIEISSSFTQPANGLRFTIINNTGDAIKGHVLINPGDHSVDIPLFESEGNNASIEYKVPAANTIAGTNLIVGYLGVGTDTKIFSHKIINWKVNQPVQKLETIDLSNFFNDKVTNIFKNQYLSPRPKTATLQLPVQGIGDWTHPLKTADIDDKGLRKLAGEKNRVVLGQGIFFSTPSDTLKKNILFTSQWDNYPREATVPLTGHASHLYLLMAGSTNPMQSRIINGFVIVTYTEGSADTLALKNPESWWPIEQDYMDDGYAFQINEARPVRIHLKTGKIVSALDNSIAEYNGKMIEGGAATVLDLPLDKNKTLQSLRLQAYANDVVIGLMSITLQRN